MENKPNPIQKFILFVKNKPLIAGILIVVIIVIISLIFQTLTPAQLLDSVSKPSLPSARQASFTTAEINLNLPNLNIPEYFTVVNVENRKFTLRELGMIFQLNPDTRGQFWTNTSQSKAVSQDPYINRFSFFDHEIVGDFDESTIGTINIDDGVKSAQTFVSNVLNLGHLSPDLNNLLFFEKSKAHSEEVDREKASEMLIHFDYFINNYPTFSNTDIYHPIDIVVDSTNKVTGFTMSETLFVPLNSVLVKSLSLSEIKDQLINGNSTILRVSSADPDGFDLSQILTFNSTNIQIEYRLDAQNQRLIPMYHIRGVATTEKVKEGLELELLVPAVKVR